MAAKLSKRFEVLELNLLKVGSFFAIGGGLLREIGFFKIFEDLLLKTGQFVFHFCPLRFLRHDSCIARACL